MDKWIERFRKYYMIDLASGCWLWIGAGYRCEPGYGRFRVGRKSLLAHRFSYEQFKGKIPEKYVVDHICNVRRCVNPDHLQAVTQQQNVRNGPFRGVNKIYKLGKCGHEKITYPNGRRRCRICENTQQRINAQKKKLYG